MGAGPGFEQPIEGTAQVLACTQPPPGAAWGDCVLQLVVMVPGREPYALQTAIKAPVQQWPMVGIQLPVTVDGHRPDRLEVQWHRVPTRDQMAAQRPQIQVVSAQLGGRPHTSGARPGGRGAIRRMILIALFAVVVVGAVVFLVTTLIEETAVSVEGSLELDESWGGGTFTPTGCQSGFLANFHGVDLYAAGDPRRVRVLQDATGAGQVILSQSGREPLILTSAQCSGFRIGVSQTGTRINHVYAYEGVARLACPQVSGSLAFDNCAD